MLESEAAPIQTHDDGPACNDRCASRQNAAGVGKLATKSIYILEMSTYIFSVAYKGALRLQGE